MPYVSPNPTAMLFEESVGTGECVPLVQKATGAPLAGTWTRGILVKGNFDVKIGSAIATFDEHGRYANRQTGNHAAIYMGQDAQGIMVIDQWNNRRHGMIVGKQAPHIHMLLFGDKRPYVDNGNNFYVVD